MDFKLNNEQRKKIQSLTQSLAAKMSNDIISYIEKEFTSDNRQTIDGQMSDNATNNLQNAENVNNSLQNNPVENSNDELLNGGFKENSASELAQTQTVYNDFAQAPVENNQPVDYSMPTQENLNTNNIVEPNLPTPVDHSFTQNPDNFSIPASEVAPEMIGDVVSPPPAQNAFANQNSDADTTNLDGSDLNYVADATPAPTFAEENPIPNPFGNDNQNVSLDMQSELPPAPPISDLSAPQNPEPAPISFTPPTAPNNMDFNDKNHMENNTNFNMDSNVSVPAPASSSEPAPAEPQPKGVFPKAHGILNKVLAKGWGKKKDDTNTR